MLWWRTRQTGEGATSDASCAPCKPLPSLGSQHRLTALVWEDPLPSLSPEHFLFCCKGPSLHPAQLQWGSWKWLKSMTPSQETWACWTQGSCEKHCSMWQHLRRYQLPSQHQLPGRHHSRAPQIRFAGVPWGWLITRGFFHQELHSMKANTLRQAGTWSWCSSWAGIIRARLSLRCRTLLHTSGYVGHHKWDVRGEQDMSLLVLRTPVKGGIGCRHTISEPLFPHGSTRIHLNIKATWLSGTFLAQYFNFFPRFSGTKTLHQHLPQFID